MDIVFDAHIDEQGLAALLAIASKCNFSYLRVACAARLGLDISDDLLPDGICRAGLGVGGGVGGWCDGGDCCPGRPCLVLPWMIMKMLASQTGSTVDILCMISSGLVEGIDLQWRRVRLRLSKSSSRRARRWVRCGWEAAYSGTRDGKEDLPDIDLDV